MPKQPTAPSPPAPESGSSAPAPRPRLHFTPTTLATAGGFLVLILARLILLHGDASDFPLDRNTNAGITIARVLNDGSIDLTGMPLEKFFAPSREAPEFPFIALGAWCFSKLGFGGIVSGRLVSLVAAVLTGLGLLLLGRRLRPAWIGCAALWIYALLPISVLLGRSLLPDSLMGAATVWGMVLAGAGLPAAAFARPEYGLPRRLGIALSVAALLALAALIKLPAVLLAAPIGIVLLIVLGWRDKQSWLLLGLTTLVTHKVVCMWYRLTFFNPLAGIAQISKNTNNMLEDLSDLYSLVTPDLVMQRSILVLTLPGLVFALLGWILLQRRAGDRFWLNAWLVGALVSLALTIKANTYWAYVLVPPACLVIALGLAELRQLGRAPLLAAIPVAFVLLLNCPGVRTIAGYLAISPSYDGMRSLARLIKHNHTLQHGLSEQDLHFFTGIYGQIRPPFISLRNLTGTQIAEQTDSGQFDFFLTNRMEGSGPPLMTLFTEKPIVATRALDYVLLRARRDDTIGRMLTLPETLPIKPLDLARRMRVIDIQADPPSVKPGDPVTIRVAFERGPDGSKPNYLALRWQHVALKEPFPVSPASHGATLIQWPQPVFQTPDFQRWPVQTVDYRFVVPRQFPAGEYGLRVGLFARPAAPAMLGEDAISSPVLTVEPPASPPALPVEVDFNEIVWTRQRWQNRPAWFGKVNRSPMLSSEGMMWLNPGLPVGDYDVVIEASAEPLGSLNKNRWPILRVYRPGGSFIKDLTFTSRGMRTQRVRVRWNGPQDCLKLIIENPEFDYSKRPILRLKPEDYSLDNRGLTFGSIRFEAPKN